MENKKQTYAEKLKDPRWIQKAEEIKEWDREVCQLCGNSSNLQVHHLCYDNSREPWDYPRRALVTLCDNCHEKMEGVEDDFDQQLKDLMVQLGFRGVSKFTILEFLRVLLNDSCSYNGSGNICNRLYLMPYTPSYWIFGREHKNNMHEQYRLREKAFLKLAKTAYEWNTGRKDFSEEDAFDGLYSEDIREYEREFGRD